LLRTNSNRVENRDLVKISARLIFREDETHIQLFIGHLFTNEVIVNFNVFDSSIKNKIGCRKGSSKTVTPQNKTDYKRNMKFAKKLLKPDVLSACSYHSSYHISLFCLSARFGHGSLFLRTLRK
jgi:hypothetical protein